MPCTLTAKGTGAPSGFTWTYCPRKHGATSSTGHGQAGMNICKPALQDSGKTTTGGLAFCNIALLRKTRRALLGEIIIRIALHYTRRRGTDRPVSNQRRYTRLSWVSVKTRRDICAGLRLGHCKANFLELAFGSEDFARGRDFRFATRLLRGKSRTSSPSSTSLP